MRVLFLGGERSTLGRRCYDWLATQAVDLSPYVFDPVTEVPAGWDLGMSVGYPHIVPATVLAALPVANLHTGYLPWNRGAYPNVWPILDGTPAGATLHWMDAKVDTGDVLARTRVTVWPWDTAYTLYRRLEDAGFALFWHNWFLVEGHAKGVPQRSLGAGSLHRKRDLAGVTVDLEARLPVRETLALLRARSFPGYPGLRFIEDGREWEVMISCREVSRET